MKYDVDYFIAKFEAIPEDRWTVGALSDDSGRHCALGHCGHDGYFGPESLALLGLPLGITGINDGKHPDYQQPTPKQRILAALRDVKAKQEEQR